ncbi:hypothetical protein DEO72_LG9g1489 [Vigna unguiculata]|uniref:Uncharacterized protein n=1 Tax=Vigna unguiculata TaxID=3917 RepID=A0A4D6MYC9_VIGUN|nr:hypothetical protein DEO72_LG9g1489 [Vigna unguiculata]
MCGVREIEIHTNTKQYVLSPFPSPSTPLSPFTTQELRNRRTWRRIRAARRAILEPTRCPDFAVVAAISVLKYYFNMMRLLRHGTRRKSSPIDVPPIESRGGREKRNIMVRVWCLSSNLTGLGTLGG